MPRESPVVNYLRRDAAPKNFAKNDYKLCSIGRAIKRGRGWGGRTSVLGCTSTGIYFYWAIVTDWWTSRRLFERVGELVQVHNARWQICDSVWRAYELCGALSWIKSTNLKLKSPIGRF